MRGSPPAPSPERPGLHTRQGTPVPLLGLAFRGSLSGRALDLRIQQRYRNAEAQPIEAVYLFPLPEDSAVIGVEVRVGERHYRAEIEEREAAFERYDDALAEGHGAVLLDEERPNLFHLSVGNLLPGEEALVELRLLGSAQPEGRGLRLSLPSTVAPRYTPAALSEAERAEIERCAPPYVEAVPFGWTLDLTLEMPSALRVVSSPSHPLRVEIDGSRGRVSFASGEQVPDRDLVIALELAEPHQASAWAAEAFGREHLVLELWPELPTTPRTAPRNVAFLVDCSGSMGGDSIAEARRAVELCLRQLDPGDRFQVLRFGSRFEALSPSPRSLDQASLDETVAQVRALDATMGGTEILPALEWIFAALERSEASHLDLVVLTDGEVSNEDQVLRRVAAARGRCRIFSFGIGAGASEFLVRGLARHSGGQAEMIFPGERIEPKVLQQFARLDSPTLSDVQVLWGSAGAEAAPRRLPPLFSGDALRVAARLPAGERAEEGALLRLQARRPDGSLLEATAPLRRSQSPTALALFWARSALRDLEEGEAGPRRGSQQARGTRESPAVRISRSYGLLCRETSFVAVLQREQGQRADQAPELRRVALLPPQGWHGRGSVRPGAAAALTGFGGGVAGGQLRFAAPAAGAVLGAPPPPPAPSPARLRAAPPRGQKGRAERDSEASAFVTRTPAAFASFDECCAAPGPADAGLPWYLELLLEAAVDGSFPLGDLLARRSGRSLAELRQWTAEITAAPDADRARVLATGLALVLLRRDAAAEEPQWQLAAAKAERFLRHQAAAGPAGQALLDWLRSRVTTPQP